MKNSHTLARALHFLKVQGWAKERYYTDDGKMCATGAVRLAAGYGAIGREARVTGCMAHLLDAINRTSGTKWMSVASFNDHPDTKFRDIVNAFENAIKTRIQAELDAEYRMQEVAA